MMALNRSVGRLARKGRRSGALLADLKSKTLLRSYGRAGVGVMKVSTGKDLLASALSVGAARILAALLIAVPALTCGCIDGGNDLSGLNPQVARMIGSDAKVIFRGKPPAECKVPRAGSLYVVDRTDGVLLYSGSIRSGGVSISIDSNQQAIVLREKGQAVMTQPTTIDTGHVYTVYLASGRSSAGFGTSDFYRQ
jgi:hypothetical protein